MKPTKMQRDILTLMDRHGEDIEESCYDYPGAICVGDHRHMPRRTFEALRRNGWVEGYATPPCLVGYWYITRAGRATIAAEHCSGAVVEQFNALHANKTMPLMQQIGRALGID
jgi:hypothetical protein